MQNEQLDDTKSEHRSLHVEFSEANFLLSETVTGAGKDTIWLTPAEIDRLYHFKQRVTQKNDVITSNKKMPL